MTFTVNNDAFGSVSAKSDGRAISSGDILTGGQRVVFTVTLKDGYREIIETAAAGPFFNFPSGKRYKISVARDGKRCYNVFSWLEIAN